MGAPDPLQLYLAEWYRPAVVNRNIDEVAAALGETVARLHTGGHPIRLLATVAAATDQVVYGLFAAESADTVSQAAEGAGSPADRITDGIQARIPQ
jgi:hypothetical protein